MRVVKVVGAGLIVVGEGGLELIVVDLEVGIC